MLCCIDNDVMQTDLRKEGMILTTQNPGENTERSTSAGAAAQNGEAVLFCTSCGKQIPHDSKFCNYCGTTVQTAAGNKQPDNAAAYQQNTVNGNAFQQNTMGGNAFQPNLMGGNSFQQNPMGGNAYQPNPMGGNAYQPNPMGGNGFQQNPMGGYQFPMYNPMAQDPRYKQFQTSVLLPGQREIVRCTQVSKSYGTNNALNSINLVIGNGRVIGLLGPNGSGKTTLIKLLCGLLTPTTGSITINGTAIGAATKAMVSYLPDRTYIADWMKIRNILDYFSDFYADFRRPLAEAMLGNLRIDPNAVMKTLSKGTQEKVQLVLVMSRNASLYLLDEPIAGVDPVARDYILDTIIRAHNPDSSVVISTHLITDIEPVLNEVIMIKYGNLALQGDANQLRSTFGKSLNDIFKEVFAGC